MIPQSPLSMNSLHLIGVEKLRQNWLTFMIIGSLMTFLGFVALGSSLLVTLVTMELIGWLMIIGGLFETIHAFRMKDWGGFFVDLLSGVLYAIVGFFVIAHPAATAVALTLMIAMFLMVGGIFRIVAALSIRFQNRGWLLLNGVVDVLLSTLILQQWREAGLWLIGMFIGIDMLFNGLSLVMLAIAAKRLPNNAPQA